MSKPRRKASGGGDQEDLTTAAEAADGLYRGPQGVLRSVESNRPVAGTMRLIARRVGNVSGHLTTAQQAAIDAGLVSGRTVQVKPVVAREYVPRGWNMTATHFRVPEGSELLATHDLTDLAQGHVVVAIVLHDEIKVVALPKDAIMD